MYRGFDHIGINVSDIKVSGGFYSKLLDFLGFEKIEGEEGVLGWSNGPNGFWIYQAKRRHSRDVFNRANVGLQHLAFRAMERGAVDRFYKEFLLPNKALVLDEPKEYPEYHEGYYAVFFEDPDKIKLEVMYFPETK